MASRTAQAGLVCLRQWLENHRNQTMMIGRWAAKVCLLFAIAALAACSMGGPSEAVIEEAFLHKWMVADLGKGMFYVEKVESIERGESLESNGAGGVPAGTALYPIEVVLSGQSTRKTFRYVFYEDPFGKWKKSMM